MEKRSVFIKRRFYTENDGVSYFDCDFNTPGIFHEWGIAEIGLGTKMGTVALVELEDGTVERVLPQDIKFIN